MFGQLIATLKKSPKTIVFTEGTDPRILEASARLLSGNFLKPVLVGNPEEIAAAAEDAGFNIRGAEIADPANYPEMDAMVEQMVELRKGKMTPEQCRDALKKGNYFGTMLVKMGVADCLLGGATYSTADTVRPALQLIKTKPGSNIVSSCFIMVRPAASGENEVLAMARLRHQHQAHRGRAGRDLPRDRQVREDLRRRPQGRLSELLHARLRQGRGRRQDAQRLREGQGRHARHPHRTASSSSTRRSPPSSPRPSISPTPGRPATPTLSSSPTSTRATSATRSPSVWATSTPTAPSCSA